MHADRTAITDMLIHPLPPDAQRLCQSLAAPDRLTRHLTLVHHVATQLTQRLATEFPTLPVDPHAVAFGAATHDLGKTLHPQELTSPGHLHEQAGPPLLEQHAVPPHLARFARTHATWPAEPVELEDLLVALADTVWKGKRDDALEQELTQRIARATDADTWHVFETLDRLLTDIANQAEDRLAWQREQSDQ